MFAEDYNCESFLNKIYFVFYQKYICQDKYPAGYPVSGPNWISGRISGIQPDIRQKQYPVHPYSRCLPLQYISL
jgi:hypothetical protein